MSGIRVLCAGLAVAVCVACGSGGTSDEDPPTSPTPADPQVGRALAALMSVDEIPVRAGEQAQDPGAYTATGPGQVGAPWSQFMICSAVGMPDDGPPLVVEPGARAGAWVFGSVVDEDGGLARQIDQYAIVYDDEGSAVAAVERSRGLDCDAAIRTWATSDMTWSVAREPVPGPVSASVAGFLIEATFRHGPASVDTSVSAVLQSGDSVLYLRISEALGSAYVDSLLGSAAQSLAAATR